MIPAAAHHHPMETTTPPRPATDPTVPTAGSAGAASPTAGDPATAGAPTAPAQPARGVRGGDDLRHTWWEDVLGLATGVVVLATGLVLLHAAGAVTGGTAGLSLLLSYAGGWPVGVVLTLVNLPFIALAVRRRGWGFTLRSVVCVVAVSVVQQTLPAVVHVQALSPLAAVLLGDLLCGVGLLIVFRHRSSLGGFTVVALLAEERCGWRAGTVLMVLDATVVLASAGVVDLTTVLLSAVGSVLLNVVLVFNHRPGRYLG